MVGQVLGFVLNLWWEMGQANLVFSLDEGNEPYSPTFRIVAGIHY